MTEKTRYRCCRCGGENLLRDAYVAVNDPDDVRLFDDVTCDDCGESVSIEEVPAGEGAP